MIYGFKCSECGAEKEVVRSVKDRNIPFPCSLESCEGTMRREFDSIGVSFVLKGVGWAKKDGKEKAYRIKRSANMGQKMRDVHQKSELIPNYNGKQTESWREAQNLAVKDGKNSSSYNSKVVKEQAKSLKVSA